MIDSCGTVHYNTDRPYTLAYVEEMQSLLVLLLVIDQKGSTTKFLFV